MLGPNSRHGSYVAVAMILCVGVGCATGPPSAPKSIGQAWQRERAVGQSPTEPRASSGSLRALPGDARRGDTHGTPRESERPIATINGQPISRHRMVNLLLRSHGAGVLEQLIVLDEAERLAAEKGLIVTDEDVDREYAAALRGLIDPMAAVNTGPIDRYSAERTLDAVLSSRNVSREEFMLGIRRQTYLRRIAQAEMSPTDEQLREEFARRHGERAVVRHIQLATPRQVAEVRERIDAGEDFGSLARRYSANTASARAGGLLDPFSRAEDRLPDAFRRTAFTLRPGDVSDAVRMGEWYHVIRLDRILPAASGDWTEVRGELEAGLRERLGPAAMQRLYERLFREANIEIHDAVLQETFERTHADR